MAQQPPTGAVYVTLTAAPSLKDLLAVQDTTPLPPALTPVLPAESGRVRVGRSPRPAAQPSFPVPVTEQGPATGSRGVSK